MNTTPLEDQNQTLAHEKLGVFSSYFAKLKVGSLLNRSGIVKTKGASPLEIFTIIFNLSFVGKNFYEGIVRNRQIKIGKDAGFSGDSIRISRNRYTVPGNSETLPETEKSMG